MKNQDEVCGSLVAVDHDDDDDGGVGGEDMPDGPTLEKMKNICKTQESDWNNFCEHFASKCMTLEKRTSTDSNIDFDEMYYDGKMNELVRYFLSFQASFTLIYSNWNVVKMGIINGCGRTDIQLLNENGPKTVFCKTA